MTPAQVQVYRVSPGLGSQPWLYFAGGIGLIVVAAFGFLLSLRGPGGTVRLHLSSTLPTLFAVGLLSTGYQLARSPRQIALDEDGLRVGYPRNERLLPWDDIAWSEAQTQAVTNRRIFLIYGNDGKVLLKIPSSIEPFGVLVAAIQQRLSERPSPRQDVVRWRKSRRQAKVLLAFVVLPLAGATWTAWMAYDTHRAEQLMRTQGVDGEAVVVRKFIAPDGRTRRVEFRVADAPENAYLHNVELDPQFWALLQTGARLPVKTVPGHPEIAHLRFGEIKDDFLNPSPLMNGLLSLGLLVMAILFLVGSILGFKGIDIATDPVTGKLKINRLPK